jgi:hypothetical protein
MVSLSAAPVSEGVRVTLSSFLQIGAGMALWIRANRQARAFAIHVPPVRTAALTRRDAKLPGGWLLFIGPVLIVAGTIGLVFLNRETLPDTSVYRSLGVALFVVPWMLIFGYYTMFRTRQINAEGPDALREWNFKRFNFIIVLASAYLFSLMNAGIITWDIWPDSRPGWVQMSPLFIAPFIIMVAVVFYAVRYGQGGMRRSASLDTSPGDRSPDERWKWGIFYYNPDDPAFLVEKRMGFGWTFNFANAWSWVFIVLMVAAGPLINWLF